MKVGNYVFVVKHVAPKELPIGSPTSTTVLQALRHLGKDAIDTMVLSKIRKALPVKQRSRLLVDAKYTTDWIADAVRKIVEGQEAVVSHG